jgi:hypothetical protein
MYLTIWPKIWYKGGRHFQPKNNNSTQKPVGSYRKTSPMKTKTLLTALLFALSCVFGSATISAAPANAPSKSARAKTQAVEKKGSRKTASKKTAKKKTAKKAVLRDGLRATLHRLPTQADIDRAMKRRAMLAKQEQKKMRALALEQSRAANKPAVPNVKRTDIPNAPVYWTRGLEGGEPLKAPVKSPLLKRLFGGRKMVNLGDEYNFITPPKFATAQSQVLLARPVFYHNREKRRCKEDRWTERGLTYSTMRFRVKSWNEVNEISVFGGPIEHQGKLASIEDNFGNWHHGVIGEWGPNLQNRKAVRKMTRALRLPANSPEANAIVIETPTRTEIGSYGPASSKKKRHFRAVVITPNPLLRNPGEFRKNKRLQALSRDPAFWGLRRSIPIRSSALVASTGTHRGRSVRQ